MTSQPCRHRSKAETSSSSDKDGQTDDLTQSRIDLIRDTLRGKFAHVQVITEGKSATYEISTKDADIAECTLKIDFPDTQGQQATVHATSEDETLAKNVQDCIESLAAATYPIDLAN
jgi:hypothetical protein